MLEGFILLLTSGGLKPFFYGLKIQIVHLELHDFEFGLKPSFGWTIRISGKSK